MLTPSEIYRIHVKDLLRVEMAWTGRTRLVDLERRLWETAAFDSYIVGKNDKPLLDDLGKPKEESGKYAAIIDAAILEYVVWREGL